MSLFSSTTALSESLLLMLICDIFSLLIPTYLHFFQVRKPILDTREKSNHMSQRDQHPCLWFRFWDILKYMKFLWSFRISIVCLVPSRMCLHSSRPQMTNRSSLLWTS